MNRKERKKNKKAIHKKFNCLTISVIHGNIILIDDQRNCETYGK